jgi:hypothetical protein
MQHNVAKARAHLFLAATARCGDFRRAHEVANVLLQKFVVVVELVVLFTYCLNAVEDGDERVLQSFCMSMSSS